MKHSVIHKYYPIKNERTFEYNNLQHLLPTKTSFTNSDQNTYLTKIYYPDDVNQISGLSTQQIQNINKLNSINLHYISAKVLTEELFIENGNTIERPIAKQRVLYKDWGDDMVLPELVQISKHDDILDDIITYHDYDSYGNPLELSRKDGASILYIWGYDGRNPIAKIENASLNEVATALGITRTTLKNFDETDLPQLNALRSHPDMANAMIATYEYEPLVGVTKMTDPRGNIMTYHYDEFNRLEFIKDKDGKLISENKYNYKN